MNIAETSQVLAAMQIYDNRRVDEATVKAWHRIIGRFTLEDCYAAVEAHYTETTDWLMPGHVVRRVKSIRARRIALAGNPVLHQLDEFDLDGKPAPDREQKQKKLTRLIADGTITPAEYETYQNGGLGLEELQANTRQQITE